MRTMRRGAEDPRMAVAVVLVAVFMTNLDLWIVNVALPAIGTSFSGGANGPSLGSLSWILNAYAIAFAALLVVAGRAGDRMGQRPVFLAGIAVFTVASLGCALAPDLGVLIVARVVQATGAAAQIPASLALMLATVPAERRTRATRSWAAVGGLAAAAGPVVGGLLVEVDWRWVFAVNVPIGIAALVAGRAVLPAPAARESGPLPDLLGGLLVILSVAALSGALVQGPGWGWASGRTVLLLAVAVVSGAAFLFRSLRHPRPLFELDLLRLPRFGAANAGSLVFGVAFAILLLSNVLWCQEVWHWSALRTGLALFPGPALVPVVTLLTARAAHRFGHGPLVAAGGLLFTGGMVWLACFASVTPNYVRDLLPGQMLTGAGIGLALGTLVAAGVQALPGHRAATGSALVNSVRQLSSTIGVAVLVAVVGSRVDAASAHAFRIVWYAAAALALSTSAIGVHLGRAGSGRTTPAVSKEPGPGTRALTDAS
ncbi:MFS transporter [Kitasatospora sp. NPDC059571]|uniref:MFS transporter n=1 Tax=Kitasatospora sp. NPDC059571 TaxID=3346871 RepID=UPI00369D753A